MKELSKEDLLKINMMRRIFEDMHKESNVLQKINYFFNDGKNTERMILEGIDYFLTHSLSEIEKDYKEEFQRSDF